MKAWEKHTCASVTEGAGNLPPLTYLDTKDEKYTENNVYKDYYLFMFGG